MQQLLEDIIYELINSNKIKYKLLGMKIYIEFNKKTINDKKRKQIIESLKKQFLLIITENIDEKVATQIKNNNTIIRLVKKQIQSESNWIMDKNGNFSKKEDNFFLTITRKKDGYHLHPRKNLELGIREVEFYNEHQEQLQAIHKAIQQNESFLENTECFITNNDYKRLIQLLVQFIHNKEEIKEVKKLYK